MSEARALSGSSGKTIAYCNPVSGAGKKLLFRFSIDDWGATPHRSDFPDRAHLFSKVVYRQYLPGRMASAFHPAYLRCP